MRQALRTFSKSPGFTTVVLLTLALGIGGSTSMFSVVNGVLLRPLPYPDPDGIVSLAQKRSGSMVGDPSHTAGDFLDLQREVQSFAASAAYRGDAVDITSEGAEPRRLDGALVTGSFFDVFKVPAARGRTFTAADAGHGDRFLVISDAVWQQQFGSDPGAIGRSVRVNGQPHVLVGVMPRSFDWPAGTGAWVMSDQPVPPSPIEVEGNLLENREVSYFQVVARLRSGLSLSQAESDVAAVARRIGERHARSAGRIYRLIPLRDELVGDVRQGLLLLLGAVGCVLLIGCANVAGLLVARGIGRQRELGIRAALGAHRGRIFRQLLVESMVLALAGGALGLLLAWWATDVLVRLIPDNIPRLSDVVVDARVALFAAGVAIATGIVFGLAPAVQTSRVNVIELLRGGRSTDSGVTRRMRGALVVAEVALALTLLITAGLMINSFVRLRAVDPGYATDRVVTTDVMLPGAAYGTTERQIDFYRRLLERTASSPVTKTSALIFPRPFSETTGQASFELERGTAAATERDRPRAQLAIASPLTFSTLGIPLMAGRTFSAADADSAPKVVIVNRAFANRYWPGEQPIGKRLTFDRRATDKKLDWTTIVGVVGDTRPQSLAIAPAPIIYLPFQQFSLPFMALVVRGTQDSAMIANEVRSHIRALDPDLPVEEVRTLQDDALRTTAQPRFRTYVLAAFGAVSLLLAAIGLYGLLSYSVSQRVREIGVRMALGAKPRDVLSVVVGEGMKLVAIGTAAGIAVAVAAGRLVSALLFDVSATDPLTFAVVTAVLTLVAFGACYLPALRAARVNPMAALRAD